MKLSQNLLKQFVKINLKPEQLSNLLSERAFEVEGFEISKPEFSKVVTAKVTAVEKHPNADRLRVVTLSIGKQSVAPVVCGAHNFDVGDIVALALPGAFVPKNAHDPAAPGEVLQKATIRGVESQGMICAEFELGLTPQVGEGIWVLPKDTKVGMDLAKLLGEDVIYDVSLPANRPDLFSHLGVAREIAAVTNQPVSLPKLPKLNNRKKTLPVKVEAKAACKRYIAVELSHVTIGSSPLWLQQALRHLGIRPINNVVDITNYVAIEYGQPLHAFDKRKIDKGIVVRMVKAQEQFETLDHKKRSLNPEMLVIADAQKTLAVAGVMGGTDSEVAPDTTDIILEAATFDPITTRKSAQALSLRTDSSAKFEKGLHPHQADLGAARALELLVAHAGAVMSGMSEYAAPIPKVAAIRFRANDITKLIGAEFKAPDIKKYLSRYGVKVSGASQLLAQPPYFRPDLTTAEDLAEEIIKIQGINNIPHTPLSNVASSQANPIAAQLRMLKDTVVKLGYSEVQNYSFVSATDIIHFGDDPKKYLQVANPLSADQGYLKKNLQIPLFKNIAKNSSHYGDVRIFEVGKEYLAYDNEPLVLALTRAGKNISAQQMVAETKGDVQSVLEQFGIFSIAFSQINEHAIAIERAGDVIGSVELISPKILKHFDVDVPVIFARCKVEKIFTHHKELTYRPISKFPAVYRDISIIIPSETPWQQIQNLIADQSPLITHISISEAGYLATTKDSRDFHAALAQKHQKNIGLRLELQSFEKTLTEEEIGGILEQIVLKLKQELKAEIR